MKKILFIVTEDWYFVSHRLHIAIDAISKGYSISLLTRISKHKELIERSGVEVIEWNINRSGANIFSEIRTIYSTFLAIKQSNPDIVHAVALKPLIYSAIFTRYSKVHNVFALGGLGFIFSSESLRAKVLKPIIIKTLKIIFKNTKNRLILQNLDDKNFFIENKIIKNDKVFLIRGSGVNTSEYYPDIKPKSSNVVILPARMLWNKGVSEFIFCAKKFKKNKIPVRFCLVGGPDIHNPESISVKELEQWNKEGIIEWWGEQKNMPEVYSKASIVCFPSYREGLPKSLLEAASCALPIVAFDVPGCREIVKDGFNGFLSPFKEIDSLYIALSKLIEDSELSKKMGLNGRDMVLSEFSQEIISSQTISVWEELV